jgi:hypothetical protein
MATMYVTNRYRIKSSRHKIKTHAWSCCTKFHMNWLPLKKTRQINSTTQTITEHALTHISNTITQNTTLTTFIFILYNQNMEQSSIEHCDERLCRPRSKQPSQNTHIHVVSFRHVQMFYPKIRLVHKGSIHDIYICTLACWRWSK